MKTTIKDVAKACGLSVSSVSMALSDKPNRISEATKTKVREVAKELNFRPNRTAVSLVNQKSKLIGIVIDDISNTHIASLFMAINREIEGKGYSLICHITDREGVGFDNHLIDLVASENIAALVWCKSPETSEAELAQLRRQIDLLDIPVFTMYEYNLTCPGIDVCFEYREGAYIATKHLLEYGHRRIGCLAGKREYKVTGDRIAGYCDALKDWDIPVEDKLIFYGDYTMESGYRAMSYLLGQNISAIFSFNDEMAFGLYQAARNYGVRIPQDLSVIGFDDVPFADVMETPLSTIRVPTVEMGRYIGMQIIEFLEKEERGGRRKVLYRPDLMLRGSTMRLQVR